MSELTLTDFLLARIAEDEAVARDALDGPWRINHMGSIEGARQDGGAPLVLHPLAAELDDLEHIARHDPARVLAECAAKRRIGEEYLAHVRHYESREADGWPADAVRRDARVTRRAVEMLAAVYAEHPDYRKEWKP